MNLIVESGAVPSLVKHLQEPRLSKENPICSRSHELEVEKISAFTLGLLAIKPENQQLIVDAGALPHLVALLKKHKNDQNSRAVNGATKEASDAITNLAHENGRIKTLVRLEGGIPPLVELLDSSDAIVQRAALGALRTLALKNDENKTQIVECNALPTLVLMLRSEDIAIHYEGVGVIGNLVHSSPKMKREVLLAGALQPVIELLSSTCSESQREAALLIGQFAAADTDCKVHIVQRGAVGPLIELLQSTDAQLKEMSAFALGRLAQDTHNQAGIAYGGGIIPLLKLLESRNGTLQHNSAFALYGLAENEDNIADLIRFGAVQKLLDGDFVAQPTRDCVAKALKRLEDKINGRVYFGEQYVNNPTLSDVTFLVEGKRFYAHRICLLASSDAFRAMLDGGYKEKDAKDIEIPNIRWETFELMMRYIYTGSVEVHIRIAQDLLRAADQYLIDGLKRLCEHTIAKDIRGDNIALMFDLSEDFNAVSLRDACILFVLEHFGELYSRPWYASLFKRILPEIRNYFVKTLTKPVSIDMMQ